MKDKLSQLVEKFNQLELRMRLMLTVAAAMLVALIIDLFWLSPLTQEIERTNAKIEQLEKQIVQTIDTQDQLNQSIASQRNHPKLKQIKQFETQLAQAKAIIKERASHLVAPSEMAEVLKDIISRSNKLKLVALTKRSPVPLFQKTEDQTNDAEQLQMYRHAIELVLDGSFSDTTKFLEQLEKMEQQVEFNRFEFKVEAYPKSKVTLVVSTLSFERKWIGG